MRVRVYSRVCCVSVLCAVMGSNNPGTCAKVS